MVKTNVVNTHKYVDLYEVPTEDKFVFSNLWSGGTAGARMSRQCTVKHTRMESLRAIEHAAMQGETDLQSLIQIARRAGNSHARIRRAIQSS